jgi:predicted RNase H-like HicB family nuclease
MREFVVVVEPTSTGFSAYVPELPGCVAAGADRKEVLERTREAIALQLGAGEEPAEAEVLTVAV